MNKDLKVMYGYSVLFTFPKYKFLVRLAERMPPSNL